MASVTTYPSQSSVPAFVAEERLRSVLQRQQHDQSTAAPVPTFNYLVDVPISQSDVSRWGTVFSDTETRSRAQRGKTATSAGSAEAASGAGEGEREEEEGGLNAYFLNADIMLNHMSSDVERKGAIYARLAPFPPFRPDAVATLPMTKVLKFRREWLPYRQQFPLHQQRTQFLDVLLSRDVVALVGAPGSGRTLQTPTILTETEALKRRRVILVAANAVAARLTAVRLREERGEDQQSRNVAVVLPLCNEATAGTVIVITTAEVLLRQLLADPLLVDVGCVIFDDVHLRTAETELCLSLLRERIAHHHMHETVRKAAGGDAAGAGSAAVRRIHVFLNCPDEATATPLLDFFNAPVTTTSTAYAGAVGSAAAAASSASSTSAGGGSSAVSLPPCSTGMFVLEGTSGLSGPVANGVSAGAGLVRGGNHFVYHVEELIQWLHKCQTEGRSVLCADPENDLLAQVESVDVVTRVMAAADADFTNLEKCRAYWCLLIREAIQHYANAQEAVTGGDGEGVTVMVVAPNATMARFIHDYLRNCLGGADATASGGNEEETPGKKPTTGTFVFTLLDEHRTGFETFLAVAQRRQLCPPSGASGGTGHIILTTPELAQTVIPPTVAVGLLIDCARTSHRSFDVNAVSDQVSTEYASTQALRYRRAIAASAKGVASAGASGGPNEDEEEGGASFPLASRFMTVQLIPKSILHSVQHRRFSTDPAHQHPAFRLSFERYVRLYQVLQAREEAALYARQVAVRAGTASTYLPMSTISHRIAQLLTGNLVAVPSATSGNRYEHMRRVFTMVENYLVAAGHIDVDSTGSGAVGEMFSSMKPLGVLVTLLSGPLPISVSRLLILSALFSCAVEGTAVAAMWIVGDAFNSGVNSGFLDLAAAAPSSGAASSAAVSAAKTPAELAEAEEELRELTKEARLFFSRESLSDVVSGFYVYKMWLAMRGGSGASASKGSAGDVSEDEKAFLEECRVPRRLLLMIEATHAHLHALLLRSGIAGTASQAANGDVPDLSASVVSLPDDAILDAKVQAALTGALYPNCAVMEDQRDAKISAMILVDALHVVSAGRSNATGTTVTAKRYGVFAESSVVNDGETAAKVLGKPFLFLDKVVGLSATGTNAAHVAVLEQAAPLQQEASIVLCGEGHVRPRAAPTRCRGWTPCLTAAWRHTRRARLLPPPAQLPTPSIPLVSYDTVQVGSVIVSTDDNFQFTMRATASQWLLQLRGHIQRQLKGFLRLDQQHGSIEHGDLFGDVAQAWDWWWRRKRDGPNWLREERRAKQHSATREAGRNGESDGGSATAKNLYGFYVFTTEAGVPEAETLPTAQPVAKPSAATAATTAGTAEADAKPVDGISISVDDAAATGAAGDSFTSPQQPKVYTGKRPSDDVDQVIRMCVEGIAKRRTREHETQLLEDDPVTFGFLNPENEFHEYYLYRLREAAPTLEVLGDSLDELVEFLEKLERDLREEIGYKEPVKAEPAASHKHSTHTGQDQGLTQFSEMAGNEADAYYYGSGSAGLQVETDASVRVKKQSIFSHVPKAEAAPPPRPQQPTIPAPIQVSSSSTATPAAPAAPTAAAPSGQQTLMEKLMAMKNASAGGASAPAPGASAPPPQPAASQPTLQPTTTPVVSKEALLAALLPNRPPAQPVPTPGPFKPPASTEELLAILKGTAPASAPKEAAPAAPAPLLTPSPLPPAEPQPQPQRAPPSTAELLALLGLPAGNGTVISPQPPHAAEDPSNEAILPMPSYGLGMLPPMGHSDPMNFYNPTAAMMMAPPHQPTSRYLQPPAMMHHAQQHQQQQQLQQPFFAEEPARPPVNPLRKPPPPLPAKVVDESPASVLVYPLPDKQKHGNTLLFLAKALGEELDMKVGPTTIVGRVARIMVPNSKVAARALALRKFKCCGEKVYIFKNDRIIDNPDGVSSITSGRMRGRGREAAMARGGADRERGGSHYDAALPYSSPLFSQNQQQQQQLQPQQHAHSDPQFQNQEAILQLEQYAAEDYGEDDEDPTSTAFQQAQEHLPAGIAVGAFSDSDDEEE